MCKARSARPCPVGALAIADFTSLPPAGAPAGIGVDTQSDFLHNPRLAGWKTLSSECPGVMEFRRSRRTMPLMGGRWNPQDSDMIPMGTDSTHGSQ